MNTQLNLADRWRRWSYLQDVDLWLSGLPRHRRRAILTELRANLAEAAAAVGMSEAIAELGTARSLARSYLDEEPRRGPDWMSGATGAVIALGLGMYALMIYVFGMLDALNGVGGGTVTGNALGVRVRATHTTAEISASFSGFSWIWCGAVIVVWLLCARVWRLLRRPARKR